MLNIRSFNASDSDVKIAVNHIVEGISQENIKLILFFASTKYDFEQTARLMKDAFSDLEVVGCTTSGEIGPQGFSEGSISAMSIAADDFEVSTFVMKDIRTKSMHARNDLIRAGKKVGLSPDDTNKGFIITLIDAMQASEEKVMYSVGSAFPHLPLVGGSAADDFQFKESFVSANGEIFQNAAIITFVKTNKQFFLYKENIYVPTEIEFKVTKSDLANRIVNEFDGKPAADEYAKALGITVEELPDYFSSNPLGRLIFNSVWISTPVSVLEDKSITVYSAISENSKVRILKPTDSINECKKSVETIMQNLPNCKGVLLFNCSYRYLQQKKEAICPQLVSEFSKCGSICGLNTYGEQLNMLHVNQTLTLIAFGE